MDTFKVATYGTLMKGERNERWGQDALERVPCVIRGRLYDTGWGFPAFVPDEAGQEVASELLTVTKATLAHMDVLEGVPRLYRRERITVALSGGKTAEAWVYIMNRLPPQARLLACGDWRIAWRQR